MISFILTSLNISWLKKLCPVSASAMSEQHFHQYNSDTCHGSYLRVALMTIIIGCGAATIRGQLLYELWPLTGQIQHHTIW